MTVGDEVCPGCARRTWLLERLIGHLDVARQRISELLGLPDAELIAAVAGAQRREIAGELAAVDPGALAADRARAGLQAVCRCADGYPARLRELPGPPAVLHVAGGLSRLAALIDGGLVAIVGARTPSPYGRQAAQRIAGDCARAGLTVVSGLALGVDGRAHAAALSAGGATVAVLPCGADRAYPAAHRALHRRIPEHGLLVSELGPGVKARRWTFPARNRIIAALGAITIVVQAGESSGALITADWARTLGRPLGAVPGPITQDKSLGPHRLLRDGAHLITCGEDVLEILYGARSPPATTPRPHTLPALDPGDRALLQALADGESGAAAFDRAGLEAGAGLAALAALELSGHVRREGGGEYVVVR